MRASLPRVPTLLIAAAALACADGPADPVLDSDPVAALSAADGSPADPVLVSPEGLAQPESVAHDPVNDLYLVSNLGDPFSADVDGFISRLYPDGSVESLEWITGLISPTGIAVHGRTLWVVDRASVHTYDLDTGEALDVIPFPDGVSFLNDVCGGDDGRFYVTDTGIAPGEDGFVPTGTDAIYEIRNGNVSVFASGPELRNPNGCIRLGARNIVFTSFSEGGGVYRVNPSGRVHRLLAMPEGAGLNDSALLLGSRWVVSSWGAHPFDPDDGDAVWIADRSGRTVERLLPFVSPGDMGYDAIRDRALVPSVLGNMLAFIPLH